MIESPEAMFERVAQAIAEPARRYGDDVNYWQARFLERLRRREFLPNSPTLMNAGLPGGQLAACFVLPIEDDPPLASSQRLAGWQRIHQSRRRHRLFF